MYIYMRYISLRICMGDCCILHALMTSSHTASYIAKFHNN